MEQTSVVVVTWNSASTLGPCLESVKSSQPEAQLVVVDNASVDSSAKVAQNWADELIVNPVNAGFPSAVNQGLARCSGGTVVILNPDVILAEDTISRCQQLLDSAGATMVGANLRTANGDPDRAAARRFKSVATVLTEAMGLPRLSRKLDWQYFPDWDRNDTREVPCINGAFMMLRTDDLRRFGGMDETVFMYLEDQELCRRARREGGSIWFCSEARATHFGGTSTAEGSSRQQSIAFLHRLDATIEFIVRNEGSWTRPVVASLLLVQSTLAWVLRSAVRDRAAATRHFMGMRWLIRQFRARHAPPAVPAS